MTTTPVNSCMGWCYLYWITSEVKMKSFLLSAWTLILVAGSLNPSFSQTPEGLLESPSPLSTWFCSSGRRRCRPFRR